MLSRRLVLTLSACAVVAANVALSNMPASADSPITSSNFSSAYDDVPMVQKAKKQQHMTAEISEFLLDDTNPLDVKAAVVEALSWEGDDKAPDFVAALAKKYDRSPRRFDTKVLNADEKALLGYMRSLDDYFHSHKNLPLLKEAHLQAPSSFTIAMLYGLTQAQTDFDTSWCQSYKDVSGVLTNPNLTEDKMRESGVRTIMDYMNLYQESCYKNN